jgi:hypothetical protein
VKLGFCGSGQRCGISDKENVLAHIGAYTSDIATLQILNIFTEAPKVLKIVCADLGV